MSTSSGHFDDVRMRGFASRTTVAAAIAWIDAHTSPLPPEVIPVDVATGRVLADDIDSPLDVPGFDRAAMDGYALKAAETTGAGLYHPLSFAVIGCALPGRAFDGVVQRGQAVRIMTGAPLPAGADAVLPAEFATAIDEGVQVTTPVSTGKHVGRIGEDIAAGTRVLHRGRRLRPQDVGLLASLGRVDVPVFPRPHVRLIVTGEELVVPGQSRDRHQIYEANSYLLRGLIQRDGGIVESVIRLPDDPDRLRDALCQPGGVSRFVQEPKEAHRLGLPAGESIRTNPAGAASRFDQEMTADGHAELFAEEGIRTNPAGAASRFDQEMTAEGHAGLFAEEGIRTNPAGADVVLISGGTSVGAEDHAAAIVAALGELPIHGIAMRPSSPTGLGTIGRTLVVLLPGNPVSCLCAYDFFAGRAIRQLCGRGAEWPYTTSPRPLTRKLVSAIGRVDYCRVCREGEGVSPLAVSGASLLSSTTRADGFVVVPEESEGIAAGASVDVWWYDLP